jgi:hypothetical protein
LAIFCLLDWTTTKTTTTTTAQSLGFRPFFTLLRAYFAPPIHLRVRVDDSVVHVREAKRDENVNQEAEIAQVVDAIKEDMADMHAGI